MTSDGQPYGPIRYKELVRECYFISKNSSTTYKEVLSMTPTERVYITELIQAERREQDKMLEKLKSEKRQR